MIVRGAQVQAFKSEAAQLFRDRMAEHVQTHFPDHSKALGEPGVRQAIDYGIEKSRAYQILTERDVCKYISLMFAFGRDFDRAPDIPWASDILQNKVYQTGTDRIEALYRSARRRVNEAARRSGE